MKRFLYPMPLAFVLALLFSGIGRTEEPKQLNCPKEAAKKVVNKESRTDPALEAWIKCLSERMVDRNDTIRDSARVALVALGPDALPCMKKLAAGDDGATAIAARKVITLIEREGHSGTYGRQAAWYEREMDRVEHPWAFHHHAGWFGHHPWSHAGWFGHHPWSHAGWYGYPSWGRESWEKNRESKPESSHREVIDD